MSREMEKIQYYSMYTKPILSSTCALISFKRFEWEENLLHCLNLKWITNCYRANS